MPDTWSDDRIDWGGSPGGERRSGHRTAPYWKGAISDNTASRSSCIRQKGEKRRDEEKVCGHFKERGQVYIDADRATLNCKWQAVVDSRYCTGYINKTNDFSIEM